MSDFDSKRIVSSRLVTRSATVRRELESEVSEPTGLSVEAGQFSDALRVDSASTIMSCIQLCRTCLGCSMVHNDVRYHVGCDLCVIDTLCVVFARPV